jgi:hypothetical protein
MDAWPTKQVHQRIAGGLHEAADCLAGWLGGLLQSRRDWRHRDADYQDHGNDAGQPRISQADCP